MLWLRREITKCRSDGQALMIQMNIQRETPLSHSGDYENVSKLKVHKKCQKSCEKMHTCMALFLVRDGLLISLSALVSDLSLA